jgi:hypothetical protein
MDPEKLSEDVIKLIHIETSMSVATINKKGEIHNAPIGSLFSIDGSKVYFIHGLAFETDENLRYMKEIGKSVSLAIGKVRTKTETEFEIIKGYTIDCNIGEPLTSSPIYNQCVGLSQKLFNVKPKAVWELISFRYKIQTPGPDMGKWITL